MEAVTARPDYAEAFTGLGLSLKELGRLKEAEASFESVVHLQPDSALGLGNVAGLYYDQVRSLFSFLWVLRLTHPKCYLSS